jgi:hypothetical protein
MGRRWVVVALAMGAPACALIADIRDLKLDPSDGGGDAQVADEESEGGDGASPGGDASEDGWASDGRAPTDGDAGAADTGLAEGGGSDGALDSAPPSDGPQHDGDGAAASDASPADSQPESAASDSGSLDSGAPDAHDAAADAGPCITDLSGIGTGDFHIAFSMATTQTGQVALLNQRNVCFFGLFWDLRIYSGTLDVQTDDSANNFVEFQTTVPPLLNDGNLHAVVVHRAAQVITVTIDGTPAGTSSDVSSFASLPALQTGHDPCETGPMKDGTVSFAGTLKNVCITAP